MLLLIIAIDLRQEAAVDAIMRGIAGRLHQCLRVADPKSGTDSLKRAGRP
jgi:hypothetical protein